MRILREFMLRREADKRGREYVALHGNPNTPTHHRRLIRYLRLSKGKPAFTRPANLQKFTLEGADCLEVFTLTTGKPIEKSPYYLLARMSWALSGLRKEPRP